MQRFAAAIAKQEQQLAARIALVGAAIPAATPSLDTSATQARELATSVARTSRLFSEQMRRLCEFGLEPPQ